MGLLAARQIYDAVVALPLLMLEIPLDWLLSFVSARLLLTTAGIL